MCGWTASAASIVVENSLNGCRVEIEGSADELAAVSGALARCGGDRRRTQVIDPIEPDFVRPVAEVLARLTDEGFIVDARRQPRALLEQLQRGGAVDVEELLDIERSPRWRDPRAGQADRFFVARAPLGRRDDERASSLPVRHVEGAARAVEAQEVATLLAYGYRTAGRWKPVASAGRLWPLVLHALVARGEGFALSWFDGDHHRLIEVGTAEDATVEQLFWQAEIAADTVERRRAVVVISADLSRVARKYGNRGGLFVILEAGALLQQIALSAGEHGLAVRTVSGFSVADVRALVDPSLDPLALVVVEGR
ncbi:nitroreductase family protein [Solirubrobacter sp. CPCC 204708]|uniref:Nitroreductase family protein n=1 Tax=Solirubrobacter deserti TaxID=2282478 RepID=A0ABT4RNI8_9ACTN|nr:nitroreductase family protein [Solirubrobacter deserti]MBE2318366.1 nitroreductase family protein [Solirubrobacter deserti]MDA0140114.1 nitroreductase family protein [Solirubrobacter deserti]